MTWTASAAETLEAALRTKFDNATVAVAAIDADDIGIAGSPGVDRRFEIGSVTKTMTATVLAQLLAEGALELDEEIGRWLAAGPHAAITLRQLATHTSGLPSVPPDLRVTDRVNPWAGYDFARAENALPQARLSPGNPWRYSNFGYQLLGLVLTRAGHADYPDLLAHRLFTPLAMDHSGVGDRGAGTLVGPRADHPLGAGGVEASIDDLARYARACLFPPDNALGAALTRAQAPLIEVGNGARQGLAWLVRAGDVREHSGGTSGFSACVTIDPARSRAVAVLAHAAGGPTRSVYLKEVVRLVLADRDPGEVPEVPAWENWERDALELARAFTEGRIEELHERLAAPAREKISTAQLNRAFAGRIRPAGAVVGITVSHHETAATGAVVVDLEIEFATDRQRLRMVVLPTGELGALALAPR